MKNYEKKFFMIIYIL